MIPAGQVDLCSHFWQQLVKNEYSLLLEITDCSASWSSQDMRCGSLMMTAPELRHRTSI